MVLTPASAPRRFILTPKALHRHAKRAQRELKTLGLPLKLSQSQDFLARAMGWEDWHGLSAALEGNEQKLPAWTGDVIGFLRRGAAMGYQAWTFEARRPITLRRANESAEGDGESLEKNLSQEDALAAIAVLTQHQSMLEVVLEGRPIQWAAEFDGLRLKVSTRVTPNGLWFMVDLPTLPVSLAALGVPDHLLKRLATESGLTLVGGTNKRETSTLLLALRNYAVTTADARVHAGIATRVGTKQPEEVLPAAQSEGQTFDEQMAEKRGRGAYAAAIRQAMKRPPSIITMSSISDQETCGDAIRSAQTGQQVYASTNGHDVGQAFRMVSQGHGPEGSKERWIDLIYALRSIVIRRLAIDFRGRPMPVWEYVIFDESLKQSLENCSSQSEADRLVIAQVARGPIAS